MREKSNFNEIKEIFNSDDCKLDDTNLLLSSVRENVYDLRKQLAIDAFHLRDWLDASECGGIKAEPKFVNSEAKHCDKYSYIKLDYYYSELCGYMDSPYHTGYSSDDIYSDIYKIEDNSDTGTSITCVAGHESSGSIGADSVFKHKIGMQQSDGTSVTKFIMFDDAKPKVDELLNEYQSKINFAMVQQDTFDKVFNNTQKFFAKYPEIEVADHGFDHAVRVYNKAMKICEFEDELPFPEKYDKLTVICAALLHDADDHKFFGSKDYDNARKIMKDSGVDQHRIDKVVHCIDQVGFSKNKYNKPDCFEAGVARDADRLDAIGAFGIMRTFVYGASEGRPVEESVRHCSEKILHLHEHMCTSGGGYLAKDIAKHGEDFMIALGEEYALSDNIKSYGNNAIQVADNIVTRYEVKKAQMDAVVAKDSKSNLRQLLEAKIHKTADGAKDVQNSDVQIKK